ncbi:MAG TPA: histidine kinase [Ilumatobacteraceae bacterium]|nr:histidine kinase [Ilumatobacteraceae bacterium]
MTGDAAADYQPPLTRWGHTWRLVAVVLISIAAMAGSFEGDRDRGAALIVLDIALGIVAFGLVLLRRKHPFPIAVVTTVLTAVSAAAAGPAALAVVSMATRRVRWQMAWVAVLNVAAAVVFHLVAPGDTTSWLSDVVTSIIFVAAMLGWGQFVGSRRELMWNLRQRAERAEAEQELRASEARATERTRIAREMHDVVAHRISQVSMRAGALAFRDDLTVEQMRAESALIRDTANEALHELRTVLHVLREPSTGEVIEQPQPTYADLTALIERSTSDGMRIEFDDQLTAPPPPEIGRTIYRIVQEGITNARKHAPGARLRIVLANDAADSVRLTLTNPIGFVHGDTPGSGLGLIGIAERVEVAGGRLTRSVADGEFTVSAWLPCPT